MGPQVGVLVHNPRQDRLQHGKLQGHPKVLRVKSKVIQVQLYIQSKFKHLQNAYRGILQNQKENIQQD